MSLNFKIRKTQRLRNRDRQISLKEKLITKRWIRIRQKMMHIYMQFYCCKSSCNSLCMCHHTDIFLSLYHPSQHKMSVAKCTFQIRRLLNNGWHLQPWEILSSCQVFMKCPRNIWKLWIWNACIILCECDLVSYLIWTSCLSLYSKTLVTVALLFHLLEKICVQRESSVLTVCC